MIEWIKQPAPPPRPPPPRANEPEAPPPSKEPPSAGLVLVVAGALVMIVLFVAIAGGDDRGGRDDVEATVAENRTPVARGLKGLEFGMTSSAAREALPDLANGTRIDTETLSLRGCDESNNMFAAMMASQIEHMPGEARSVRTKLGAFDATCKLYFAQEKLGRMHCAVELDSLATHAAAERALVGSLVNRYGPAHESSGPTEQTGFGIERTGEWRWTDAHATLVLSSRFKEPRLPGLPAQLGRESSIDLINADAAYLDYVEKVRNDREAQLCRRQRAKKRAREKKEQEELDRIREAGGNLADDL